MPEEIVGEVWECRGENKVEECHSPLFKSWRFWTTILAMLATVQLMMARMSLSMTLVCMVELPPPSSLAYGTNITDKLTHHTCRPPHSQGTGEETLVLTQRRSRDFTWSKTLQGHLLSSYFYGYIFGILPGGLAVDRWGGRLFMLLSVATIAASNFLLPSAAYTHHAVLYAVRVLQGFAEAMGLNAHQFLLARWGSRRDLSMLTSISYIGFPLGVMVAHPLVSSLCLHGPWGGWPSVFYLMGAAGGLWTIVSAFLLHNSPAAHPLISKEEIKYFQHHGTKINISGTSFKKSAWLKLARSGPVWALMGTSALGTFGYFAFTLHQPLFLRDVFGFSIKENGIMSSLPWSLEVPVSVATGVVVDMLRRRAMPLTTIKRVFNTAGFLLAGLTPLVVVEIGCEWRWAAAAFLLVVVVGNCTAFVGGYYYTPVDLAPPWAATLAGLSSTFIGLNGLVAPIAVAYLTPTGSREEWRQVFWVSGVLYLAGAIVFVIWGSAEPLPWINKYAPNTEEAARPDVQEPAYQMQALAQRAVVDRRDIGTATEEVNV
ncbi:uncharacterized transporter slc-17.2-like [Portunus trituberculatus]|uniref:uncharacterized transporter slc-17.2-like n=1 Tax=Portunus trituberculatus TaxID=210409 RepID=UPI001E1D1AD9|nr:uncharacterized transporter slc-17.2-like [Portunus trituberculatus]